MRASILALCLLLLVGCGKQGVQFSTAVVTTGGGTEEHAPAEDAAGLPEEPAGPEPAGGQESRDEQGQEGAPEAGPAEQPGPGAEREEPEKLEKPESPENSENPFEIMPRDFLFSSGVGAWGTELTIEADGSFSGLFVDSDMGVSGEGYPDGTRYVCAFSGKFSQPEPVDETTWSMEIESMELEHPADGTEEYADGVRYVYSGPYGLEDAEELLVYSPRTPAADLPEDFLNWLRMPWSWEPDEAGALGCWGIYNAVQGCGFAGFE